MRTEVSKAFNWGFLLSEQELRRVFTACKEHADKLGGGCDPHISVKLKDGSLVQAKDVDQVLSLENAGSKAIQRISVAFEDGADPSQWKVKVEFLDGFASPESWSSVRFQVVGSSRDLVFLAAAELEERVKKTRMVSWVYLTSRPWAVMIAALISMAIGMPIFVHYFTPEVGALIQLEEAYESGSLRNATEALIFYEKAKREAPWFQTGTMLILFIAAPFAVIFGSLYLCAKLFPAYNFYIGDYIAYYDKRRSISRIIWGVLILGVVASLIGGILLRLF